MKVLGVCGAQGALLFPFRKYLIGNIEPRSVFHTANEEQWNLNFKGIPFVRNIKELKIDKVDIILGSPSCGHSSVFSYSRKKSLGKPKEDVTLNLYLKSIKVFKPKIFLMENLPKLLDFIPLNEWRENLPEYKFISYCYSVEEFGNSQVTRKRLVLIGISKLSSFKDSDFKIFKVNRVKTTRELYKNVREHLNFRENDSKILSMYHYADKSKRNLSALEVKKLWNTEFKKEYKWPMWGTKMNTLPGVYRNKWDNNPLTIRPSNRQFNPNGEIMGLEEFRVIMGFPKRFKLYYDLSRSTYWLNKGRNTYSKGSVYEIGKWFKKCIFKTWVIYYARTRI